MVHHSSKTMKARLFMHYSKKNILVTFGSRFDFSPTLNYINAYQSYSLQDKLKCSSKTHAKP